MKTTSFGGTDPGKKRANNEDAYLLDEQLHLYAVADGVGGSEGGEVASRIAVETLAEVMPGLLAESDGALFTGPVRNVPPKFAALQQALILSNQKIRETREREPAISDMATTLTSLLLGKEEALIAHSGDSRAYLLRAGEFKQLTNDHSFVAEQVRAGVLTPEQASSSPYRHMITRALGLDDEVMADFTSRKFQKDDRFLLCTDGLTEMVGDAELSAILAGSSPQDAVRKLLAAANDHGGVDNITAVVVWITEV